MQCLNLKLWDFVELPGLSLLVLFLVSSSTLSFSSVDEIFLEKTRA